MSSAIRALVPTGLGINCEVETAHALRLAGAEAELVHLGDLVSAPGRLGRCHIVALAGGFSFGDHLGAGKVLANRLSRRLGDELSRFLADGGLMLGICNGFQTMVRMGILPAGRIAPPTAGLAGNRHGAFHDGWVTLVMDPASPCLFTRGIRALELPVRHGEGRLVASETVMEALRAGHQVPAAYADPETLQPTTAFPHNPNGSAHGAAALCDPSGRAFGLMPHPEAFLHPENHPRWRQRPHRDGPGDGVQLFVNAVDAARGR